MVRRMSGAAMAAAAFRKRPVFAGAVACTMTAATLASFSDAELIHGVKRVGAATRAFLPMYVDYLRHCNRCRGHDGDETFCFESRQILWREVATRFRDLCRENGGIYVKAGQHVCVQPISPEPFKEVLSVLMNQAQIRPFREDRMTFREDVGVDIEEAFAAVDPVPVASASLAQVYKARTWEGEDVAVKIQQRPVARFLWIDLATMEAYYSLLSYLIPGLRFAWLATETRRHMSEELDFREEARNADKVRATMDATTTTAKNRNNNKHTNEKAAAAAKIIIPRVHHALSGPRVLTQQWCDGVRVDDAAGLRRLTRWGERLRTGPPTVDTSRWRRCCSS